MNKLTYPLILTAALAAAACTDKVEYEIVNPGGKTAISFVGETPATRAGFAANTQIAMHIRSTSKDNSSVRETRTLANALADATQSSVSFSEIEEPNDDNIRYWDDAFGRSAKLSVFAVAVPGKADIKNGAGNKSLVDHLAGDATWAAGSLSEDIAWVVSTDQSGDNTIDNEDLVYSNNIQATGSNGVKSYDFTNGTYTSITGGELQFRLKDTNMPDGPGKFDKGNLMFTHSLSRMTVHLVKGTGYADGSFSFATGANVKILSVPTAGTLGIESGSWSSTTTADITKMATTTKANGSTYSLVAQMLPGYTMTLNDDTNVLEFIIDDNKYFVTQDMMLTALNNGQGTSVASVTMEQGKNYVFTITVGKSKIINVTATLEPWLNVEAENHNMDNSHIDVSLFKNENGTACDHFDLYRLNDESADINTGASTAKNWAGNYTDKATLTQNGTKWETNWFFENNKSFYHFRTVGEGTVIKESDTDAADYFEITSGAQASHDYHWGAPLVSSTTSPLSYDPAEGYSSVISPAIGATNSTINLTELHIMSYINVVLRTTKTSDAVALEVGDNQCEVTLTHFYAGGTVLMGNGLVSTTGSLSDGAAFTRPVKGTSSGSTYTSTGAFTFAAVPQSLVRTAAPEYVGITIKTPDNNQYYVVKNLSEIKATDNGGSNNQTTNEKIGFWYPNHTYTYTFTLTKTAIDDMTCTVSNWVDVTADNQDISLED